MAILALALAVLGVVADRLTQTNGLAAPVLHSTSLITLGAVTVVVFLLGLRVRAYQRQREQWREQERRRRASGAREGHAASLAGEPVEISPVLAARTLVLAQAIAYAGAVIFGWHAGVAIDLLLAAGPGSNSVTLSLMMMGASVVMTVVGWVVELFCRVPPDDQAGAGSEATTEGEADGNGPGYAAER
nr:DUF3180 domain-containing protein [Zhihengliuella flava]